MRRIEKVKVKLENTEAFVNTLKALIGIGFLSVPLTFKKAGILGGFLGTIIIVLLSNISNYFIFRSIQKIGIQKCTTIGELGK